MRARRLCKLPMPHPPSFSPTPPAHSAADDPVAEASCVAGSGAPPRQERKLDEADDDAWQGIRRS